MKQLYTAHITATGGRGGHAETDDKILSVELGAAGSGKKGATNPEQLFGCAYAACFGSAVEAIAKKDKVNVGTITVNADITLNQDDSNGYFLSAALDVNIADVDNATAEKLVKAAHQVCPFSKATRGNIEVTLKANSQQLAKAA